MPVDEGRFRRVLGQLAGGVCVVTSRAPDGSPRGLTATSVCSVSLEPPLVLVCVGDDTSTYQGIESSGSYAVNLLSAGQAELAVHFARSGAEKFEDLRHGTGTTGSPLLEGTLGYCDCRVVRRLDAGDHTIFVGRVEEAEVFAGDEASPLVYHLGHYRSLDVGHYRSLDEGE